MGLLSLPNGTYLFITALSGGVGLYVTPYSARALSQVYKQIGAGGRENIRRTVIGTTTNLTPPWFHQYATTITCQDTTKPTLDNTWRGQNFEVFCAAELEYISGGPNRPAVSGSTRTEGSATYYRPILYCTLMDFEATFREWDGLWQWRLEMEESALPA
jgi:hypothetical protein